MKGQSLREVKGPKRSSRSSKEPGELQILEKYVRNASNFFEFGTGASTVPLGYSEILSSVLKKVFGNAISPRAHPFGGVGWILGKQLGL